MTHPDIYKREMLINETDAEGIYFPLHMNIMAVLKPRPTTAAMTRPGCDAALVEDGVVPLVVGVPSPDSVPFDAGVGFTVPSLKVSGRMQFK